MTEDSGHSHLNWIEYKIIILNLKEDQLSFRVCTGTATEVEFVTGDNFSSLTFEGKCDVSWINNHAQSNVCLLNQIQIKSPAHIIQCGLVWLVNFAVLKWYEMNDAIMWIVTEKINIGFGLKGGLWLKYDTLKSFLGLEKLTTNLQNCEKPRTWWISLG